MKSEQHKFKEFILSRLETSSSEDEVSSSEEFDYPITNYILKKNPKGWKSLFETDNIENELRNIEDNIRSKNAKIGNLNVPYYPKTQDIFRAFMITPLSSIKVVIIGQEPYHDGKAMGFSFSMSRDTKKIEVVKSSLWNIYTELERTIKGFKKPSHGDLTSWAEQGVLLLNIDLTVRPGKPGSHSGVWGSFFNKVLKEIKKKSPNAIFMLWGASAQKIQNIANFKFKNVLLAGHPSSMNEHNRNPEITDKYNKDKPPKSFIGCNHFVEANRILKEQGNKRIDWKLY